MKQSNHILRLTELILAATAVLMPVSCLSPMEEFPDGGVRRETAIRFCTGSMGTKAMDPDECRISDINVFVFNAGGMLEGKAYLSGDGLLSGDGGCFWHIDLVSNATYSVYACANLGYELNARSMEELKDMRYYLAYPDDYSLGMPMSGYVEDIMLSEPSITVRLERLMSKITILVDRSRLDENVEFNIRSVKVEGCPRSVTLFSRNHISDPFDFFPSGFLRKDYETDALNTVRADGRSGEIHLYMLENMQGDLLPGNVDETRKVLAESDGRRTLCSYIEIKAEYMSDSMYSAPGEHLIYRLYPGNDPGNFDIVRNCEYRICISPAGSGLDGLEWRIDKSGLESFAKTLELSYSTLKFSYVGETSRISAYVTPEDEDTRLYWDSDNNSVATVSDDGIVTARSEGTCSVFCHIADGSGTSAECLVTVKPEPYYMKIFPGNFIRCRKGDIVEISCEYFPLSAPFDVGIEELEYDKSRGIYDYAIGEDGRSVTLYTKSRGSGLLYMEAGYPVNQSELIMLVVD